MSEIEKINTYNVAFQEALREGDGDKCASMCAEDAVMMPPNAPPVEGRDAIKRHFANLGPDSTVTGRAVYGCEEDRVLGLDVRRRLRGHDWALGAKFLMP